MPSTLPHAEIGANKILEALSWLEFANNNDAEKMIDMLSQLYQEAADDEPMGSEFQELAIRIRSLLLTFVKDYRKLGISLGGG